MLIEPQQRPAGAIRIVPALRHRVSGLARHPSDDFDEKCLFVAEVAVFEEVRTHIQVAEPPVFDQGMNLLARSCSTSQHRCWPPIYAIGEVVAAKLGVERVIKSELRAAQPARRGAGTQFWQDPGPWTSPRSATVEIRQGVAAIAG